MIISKEVKIVKDVIACDVLPVAMYCICRANFAELILYIFRYEVGERHNLHFLAVSGCQSQGGIRTLTFAAKKCRNILQRPRSPMISRMKHCFCFKELKCRLIKSKSNKHCEDICPPTYTAKLTSANNTRKILFQWCDASNTFLSTGESDWTKQGVISSVLANNVT